MKNSSLHKAKMLKNDEYYTLYQDIEKELNDYKENFENKIIYCNTDNPDTSMFWKYLHFNFAEFKLKKIICTFYKQGELSYKTEYTGGDDSNLSAGIKTQLTSDGNFSNEECIGILKDCDLVITNPPFSLWKPYIDMLIENKKKFLIVGDLNWIAYEHIFPLIKNNLMWTGNNYIKAFLQPDGNLAKFGNKLWFTNIQSCKKRDYIPLKQKYLPDLYPKYLNYDAINVDKVSNIPCDYDGVMGVPITFINKFNPDQFEIIGANCACLIEELGIKEMSQEWIDLYFLQGSKGHYTANMHCFCYIKDGKAYAPFRRILIKRK